MVAHAKGDPSQFSNQLSSLLQDELHIVTYKYFARKFNVSFDVSKRMLYCYFSNNREVRSFLLFNLVGRFVFFAFDSLNDSLCSNYVSLSCRM